MDQNQTRTLLRRIVSGGQTGVDRAALDAALERGIPCGGWCPKGRLAEDGPIPKRYPLRETPAPEYAQRTAWNVRDSDATLILTWGPPTNGTAFTEHIARETAKPCRVIDLACETDPCATRDWLIQNDIKTLNVAGPRETKCPGIHAAAAHFLNALLNQCAPA